MHEDNPFLGVRSVIETPILDAYKWAKVPGIPADAVLCDMEDAVPRTRKPEGREAVVRALGNPGQFGGRMVWARPNALDTEWGRDDVAALGRAGVEYMMLPKVRGPGQILEYRRLVNEHGADPSFVVCVELPEAVAQIEAIAELPCVGAFAFGEGDLTAALGVPIYQPGGSLNPLLQDARSRVTFAAASHGVARFEACFPDKIKDLDAYRSRAGEFQRTGATGMIAIYPPHVAVINDVFTPTTGETEYAREVIAAFDAAIAAGDPAIQLPGGKVLLIHDYEKARRVLARAGARDGA
jgi:citrate lyase beta subunit